MGLAAGCVFAVVMSVRVLTANVWVDSSRRLLISRGILSKRSIPVEDIENLFLGRAPKFQGRTDWTSVAVHCATSRGDILIPITASRKVKHGTEWLLFLEAEIAKATGPLGRRDVPKVEITEHDLLIRASLVWQKQDAVIVASRRHATDPWVVEFEHPIGAGVILQMTHEEFVDFLRGHEGRFLPLEDEAPKPKPRRAAD